MLTPCWCCEHEYQYFFSFLFVFFRVTWLRKLEQRHVHAFLHRKCKSFVFCCCIKYNHSYERPRVSKLLTDIVYTHHCNCQCVAQLLCYYPPSNTSNVARYQTICIEGNCDWYLNNTKTMTHTATHKHCFCSNCLNNCHFKCSITAVGLPLNKRALLLTTLKEWPARQIH